MDDVTLFTKEERAGIAAHAEYIASNRDPTSPMVVRACERLRWLATLRRVEAERDALRAEIRGLHAEVRDLMEKLDEVEP